MQAGTGVLHLTLLPAARTIYAQENAGLVTASARASGLPWIGVALVLAAGMAVVLFRAQRWLWRHTHRRVNYGLVAASVVLAAGVLWLIVAFVVARADLQRGVGHGSTPAATPAHAAIDIQQIPADQSINLTSRSRDKAFVQDVHS